MQGEGGFIWLEGQRTDLQIVFQDYFLNCHSYRSCKLKKSHHNKFFETPNYLKSYIKIVLEIFWYSIVFCNTVIEFSELY